MKLLQSRKVLLLAILVCRMSLSDVVAGSPGDRDNRSIVQRHTITGTVVDEAGSPLPGVSVMEKGTSTGATTDANGAYRLEASAQDVVLVFSFIGYAAQEITPGNRSVIDVSMTPDEKTLQEVVVVGMVSKRKLP